MGRSLDLYKSKWMKDNMDSTSASPLTLTVIFSLYLSNSVLHVRVRHLQMVAWSVKNLLYPCTSTLENYPVGLTML